MRGSRAPAGAGPVAAPSGAEPLRVRAGGLSFAALAWGPADGPLALCLHGYPDTARTWRHLGPHLAARGWRVVAPYLRGYAPTDLAPDGDYSVAALARDALALHEALGGDERAVLIGHDWGAVATYAAAHAAPERFARIVTLAVAPGPVLLSPRNLPHLPAQLRMSWYMAFQLVPRLSEDALGRLVPKLWRDWSPGYDAREDVAAVLQSLGTPERRTAALRYYRAFARRPAGLRQPRVPLLYLHGAQDGCQSPRIAARAAEIVDGAGHFLHLERPDVVNARIAAFLG